MKFSIRDLLLLMAIGGLACGWWLDHRRLEECRREQQKEHQLTLTLLDRMTYFNDKNAELRNRLMELMDARLREPDYNP